ncbi:MAG: glycosyltransferase family 39 protein [Candidatus Sungiibacteriota bacterium]
MKKVNLIALGILAVMLVLMIASAWNDAAIVDELAHIPAGFGYITQGDHRLNPEHPPLIKVLAALSANLFVHPRFPTDTVAWRDDINGQWTQGSQFLYGSGNNADQIIFWSRLPLILLAILFGWLLFQWTRRRFGDTAALLTLTFFAFSPTMLAHARFVTTDLGAAFGFFIGIAGFIAFLERPTWRNVFIAGVLCGIAQLLKFSLVLLVPMYAVLIVGWIFTIPHLNTRERLQTAFRLIGKTFAIGVVGIIVIWIAYAPLVWNYPQDRQIRDAEFLLGSYGFRSAVNLDLALIKNPVTRPLGQYVLGVLMVQQRSAGGNTAFFLGEVSGAGSRLYFPLLYLLKEPFALHLLTLLALMIGVAHIGSATDANAPRHIWSRLRRWIADHFVQFSCFVVIAIYWAISIKSPLNIGVRHILPTLPFIYLLVSIVIAQWLRTGHAIADPQTIRAWLKNLYTVYIAAIPKYLAVGALLLWLITSTLFAFPHFLSYYNEAAGGSTNGWRIAVDSNYDWGQDLKRLILFMDNPPSGDKIQKIALDYFGGADPRYYLGNRFEPWWSSRGPARGYFAISSSFRQGAFGTPAPGFTRKKEDGYEWLKQYEPIAQIGNSIFVYNLP